MNSKPDLATLNAVQQTLRTLTMALAAATKADLHVLGDLLTSGAENGDLLPDAQNMIADLGTGVSAMANRLQPDGPMN